MKKEQKDTHLSYHICKEIYRCFLLYSKWVMGYTESRIKMPEAVSMAGKAYDR